MDMDVKSNNGYLVSVGTLKLLKPLKACGRLFTAVARAFSDFETNLINYSHFCAVLRSSGIAAKWHPKFLPSKETYKRKEQNIKEYLC